YKSNAKILIISCILDRNKNSMIVSPHLAPL
ncbi:MAG: hypothetical protein ACI8RD_005082, partial [Bacillariaceae sp.]